MITLIDGDVLKYSCGFAAETKQYRVGGKVFEKKKDAKSYALSIGIDYEEITKEVLPQPKAYALANVKNLIEHIIEATGADDVQVYITGKGNYRETVAVTAPYKGNRDVTHKPYHMNNIHDYLVNVWEAQVVDGMEADDAMGIAQYQSNEETCIASIDKDLDMIPGWHYNFRKHELYKTTEEESDLFFHKQMLTGDTVDNIIGIKGIGPVKSEKLLKGKTPEERWDIIEQQYAKAFGSIWKDRLKENQLLLWILREEKENVKTN